ncbi:MAG TPA: hypothetical protein VGB52_09265 [Actinomycetota bacterium]
MRNGTVRIALIALTLTFATGVAPAGVAPAGAGARAETLTLDGIECDLIPVPKATTGGPLVPVGTGTCPGVRPGALLQTNVGLCTFNFLFQGSDGRRYIGTAGHCILGDGPLAEDAGERTWARGAGPVVRDADGRRVGEFAYAILQSPKDFALVRLDTGISASARMCYFGGPNGINTSTAGGPVLLHQWGNGLLIGDLLPARTHVTPSLSNPNSVFAYGAAMLGDSGSGVISADGKAVGVLVTIGVHVNGVLNHGVIGITRLKPQLDRAASRLRIGLSLVTATF